MNGIILPRKWIRNLLEPILDNLAVRYAAKHALESHIRFIGLWRCDVFRKGALISGGYWEPPNTFSYEGLDYGMDILFGATGKAASKIWYVGLYTENVTPAVSNTAALQLGAAGTYGALQAAQFAEDTYPSYNTAGAEDGVITNAANKAQFTFEGAGTTIYGGFLSTSSDPTETSCYLGAAKKFSKSKDVEAGDEIAVTYQITIANP